MADTTTAKNACNASVWLDSAAGTLTDVSGSATGFDPSFTQELGDYHVFQQKWKKRLACGKDGAFTLNVVYSTTVAEGFQLLNTWFFGADSATPRTLTWYLPDKNPGANKWSAEVLLSDWSWSEDPSDPSAIVATAELLPNGEVTHTIAAT